MNPSFSAKSVAVPNAPGAEESPLCWASGTFLLSKPKDSMRDKGIALLTITREDGSELGILAAVRGTGAELGGFGGGRLSTNGCTNASN